MPSILDLPEPQRSRALEARGQTAEEFSRYLSDWKAQTERDPKGGEGLHYGNDFPAVDVTERPSEEGEG